MFSVMWKAQGQHAGAYMWQNKMCVCSHGHLWEASCGIRSPHAVAVALGGSSGAGAGEMQHG